MSLYTKIDLAQRGQENALVDLLLQFNPLLKKYARKLDTEDSYEDLRCFFIELVYHFDLHRMQNPSDGALVAYIGNCVKHRYIQESQRKNRSIIELTESSLSEAQLYTIKEIQSVSNDEINIFLLDLSHILTELEQKVVYWICVEGYTSASVAIALGVTRQNINQIKQRALKKLKAAFE